ncbi:MAG TPA: magnesium transporter CorA family protein [Deltaproteobacteria bacterium]|nr:magnesium transporter CorA family protein [Deltaproteobacteria bacterium]
MLRGYQVCESKIIGAQEYPCPIEVFVNPDADEKRYLIEELKVDEHTLNSALDPDEISRLEFEPNHIALIFKMPKSYSGQDQLLFRVVSTGAFLFKDKMVLVVSEDVPLFEGKQFSRVQSLRSLFLAVLNRSAYHFMEHLKIINLLTDELEAKINESMENRYLINLFTLEKSLVYYLNAIHSNTVVIEKLKNYVSRMGFTTEESEFLDDILVENNQCFRQAEIYSNILASLMDARVSIVSNNLNILMKTLNIITICIMVPTFVVSTFSMNVSFPLQQHPYAFWIIMGMALLGAFSVMLFWRYKRL